jgi:uncharacterized protein (DUF2252 family)
MLASPFAFYRGAAIIMASDLAGEPHSPLRVQCCGDAHLANFGGFAAPDRTMVFDINDFDETTPGPFEWDVKRLATSFTLAARAAGADAKTQRAVARGSVRGYREAMAEFATMGNLAVWYSRLDATSVLERWRSQLTAADVARFERNVAKAEGKDSLKAQSKLTEYVDGEHRFVSDPPLLVPLRDLDPSQDPRQLLEWVMERFHTYRRSLQGDRRHLLESYRAVDVARKVVGVGSVGSRCFVLFLLGRTENDPLFLQIKESEASVLEAYAGKSGFANPGQRVVEGQRLLQAAGDTLLGWMHADGLDGVGRDFYVRQLWDWKLSPDFETMTPETLKVFGQMCGWTLARGHARSGDRVAISAYLGSSDTFDRSVAEFAARYADQNQADFEAVAAAVRSGALA